ncbi:MAG: DUF748 domain-containing protein [Proteobacteria bacterium]|nr:DUF748 domain-containing protein [Pseudomonadota bacterium]
MKKRAYTWIFIAIAVLALLAGVISFAARGALNAIERQRHDILGLAIEIQDYGINVAAASLALKGIKIYPAGKEDEASLLASAERLNVSLAPWDLLRKAIHARKIVLVNPSIKVVRSSAAGYNWDALDLGEEDSKAEAEDKDKESEWEVRVDSVKVRGGDVSYVDKVDGHRLRLSSLDMTISNISKQGDDDDLPTQLAINAKIDENKGSLNVKGRLNLFGEGVNFKLRSIIGNSPITYYRSFYAGSAPFPIVGGSISITSQATSKKSELVANNHATIYNLKAGGGVKGDLINAFVLKRRAPIEADVTVRGNIEEGSFSVGSRISAGIGEGILAQARSIPDLLSPAEKIKSRTKAIGDGMKGLFRR